MLWILLDCALAIGVLNHPCICSVHIDSVMTVNVPEADPEYAEVAEEYEEDVLVVGVPKAFTNFPVFGSCLR